MDMGTLLGCVALLATLGFPTVFGMTVWCIKACKKFFKQLEVMQCAQKAQMRSQLLEQFHIHEARGYISEDDLEDWINQYNAYHELAGANGVLEKRREKLIELPAFQPQIQQITQPVNVQTPIVQTPIQN